jgi:hypothetical protein
MPAGVYDRSTSRPRQKRPIEQRFFEKVQKSDGCWEWTGSKHRQGYGRIRAGERLELAHRVSWKIHFGDIPTGLSVHHSCDNPSCVNPAHLSVGTHKENMLDMARKNRHHSRLKHLVSDIKTMVKHGWTNQQVADYFGTTQPMISMIVNNKRLTV